VFRAASWLEHTRREMGHEIPQAVVQLSTTKLLPDVLEFDTTIRH
jgi:hypothetical protein